MGRKSIREQTIESGVKTLHERGFATAGVREITAAAGVPQGSFINHFGSKEAFGVLVVERYHERTQAIMDVTLRDPTAAPVERLRAYFDAITALMQDAGWRYGCLVGNMSLEAAEHSERLRTRLVDITAALTLPFTEVVRAGQASGDIRNDLNAEDLSAFLVAAWQGAMLRMKLERSSKPLEQFIRVAFTSMLAAPMATDVRRPR